MNRTVYKSHLRETYQPAVQNIPALQIWIAEAKTLMVLKNPMEVIAMAGDELDKRISRLEDIEAIKRLKALYCDICDDDHNPDRIVKIFADDGIWEGGDFGKAQGHDAIRKLFEGFQKLISFSQHNVFNPRIEVNGGRATGIWYFLGPFTFRQDNGARWIAARYDDDYVKQDGVWLYQHLRATIRMVAPYEKGWAK